MIKVAIETLTAIVEDVLGEWALEFERTRQFVCSTGIVPYSHLRPSALPIILKVTRPYIEVNDYFIVTTDFLTRGSVEEWVKGDNRAGLICIADISDAEITYCDGNTSEILYVLNVAKAIASNLNLPFIKEIKSFVQKEIELLRGLRGRITADAHRLQYDWTIFKWQHFVTQGE